MSEAETVGVTVSGGLDSAAVLYHANLVATSRGNRLTSLVIPSIDDQGVENVPIARALVDRLAPKSSFHVVEVDHHIPETSWDPVGPRLDAIPAGRGAANRLADRLGIDVILTGLGSDELLGSPRYLFSHLFRSPHQALRYLLDVRGVTLPALLALEGMAMASRLLPTRFSRQIYWAVNNAELSEPEPASILAEPHYSMAFQWTLDWTKTSLEGSYEGRTWTS
jgi:asparagine synthetase B (glutamine-hydrolysing)